MSVHVDNLCFHRYSLDGFLMPQVVFAGKGWPKPLDELPQVFCVGFGAVEAAAPFPGVLGYAPLAATKSSSGATRRMSLQQVPNESAFCCLPGFTGAGGYPVIWPIIWG